MTNSQEKTMNESPILSVKNRRTFIYKNWKTLSVSLFIILTFGFTNSMLFAAVGVPKIMSYQGRLTDNVGTLLGGAGTNYYFRFSIYDNATVGSGARLWPTAAPASTTINVANGVFNVNIGDTAGGYPDALTYDFMQNSDIFLQVEVSSNGTSFETLSPRQRIAATGFAINAGTLSGDMRTSSTADFNFNILNLNTGKANLNIATGSLLFGGSVRIDSLGQGTFTTTTISSLSVSGLASFLGKVGIGTSTPDDTLSIQAIGTSGIFEAYTSSSVSKFYIDPNGNVVIGGGTPLPNSPLGLIGNTNTWLQMNIKNNSSGTAASSDYVATADNGDDTKNYIDMGINSSGYNQSAFDSGGAGDGYLYTSDGQLTIGTATSTTAKSIIKFNTGGMSSSTTRMIILANGKVGIGTTATSTGQLNIVGSTSLASGVAGLYQESRLNATSSGGFQFGNRHIINISPTASSSMDGEFIRTVDNTSLNNTVRAMEIQAWSGTNIQGINTGLWAAGRTFGVQAFSNGTASGILNGAALYGEIQSTSTGNGLRLYSKNIASSSQDLALLFQEISNFQGNGLKMDFGRTGGSFTGNFLSFNNNNASKFAVNATGSVMIGTSTPYGVSNLVVCAQNNCTLPATTSTVAVFASISGTATGSSIIARGTITQGAADVGEHSYIEGLATDYDAGDLLSISEATSTRFKKTNMAYAANLAGVVTKTAGFIGGGEIAGQADTVVVALAGRVPVKVTGENGSIKLGDSITASSLTGYGMKSTLPGRVIGMALEEFSATSASATGTIMLFVNPSYYFPNATNYENLQGGTNGASAINIFAFDEKLTVKIATLIAGKITVEDLTIGSEEHPTGITIFDVKTKKPYCVVMENGATKNYSGKCSDLDLNNLGQPYFDSDMGGFVVVATGTKIVDINFAQEYLIQPNISANISSGTEGSTSTSISDVQFLIADRSTKGFRIIFNAPTSEALKISWIALAVKNTEGAPTAVTPPVESSDPTVPPQREDTPENTPAENNSESNTDMTEPIVTPPEVPAPEAGEPNIVDGSAQNEASPSPAASE